MKSESVQHHYYYYGATGAAAQEGGAQAAPPNGVYAPPPAAAYGPVVDPALAPGYNAHPHPGADQLVKGLVVGAGAAYLLTNETAQRFILRTALSAWVRVRGAFAEAKERFHDAEAEVEAAESRRRDG